MSVVTRGRKKAARERLASLEETGRVRSVSVYSPGDSRGTRYVVELPLGIRTYSLRELEAFLDGADLR